MGWLSFLLAMADPIERITQDLLKARADAQNAQTEQEKVAAAERVSTLQARRDVMIAEAPVTRANAIVRALLGFPVVVIDWKLLIWDKALGQWTSGHTDPLSPELWQLVMIVNGFYFLYEGAMGVTRIIKR